MNYLRHELPGIEIARTEILQHSFGEQPKTKSIIAQLSFINQTDQTRLFTTKSFNRTHNMSNAYLKKYAKRIMIQQDKRAVEMEREVEKLLYARENLSLKQLRQTRTQPEINSLVVGKLKPYADEYYPIQDLLSRKDKELTKTELLYEQLRQEKQFLDGKIRKQINVSKLDIDEMEEAFDNNNVVRDYIHENSKGYVLQRRQLKHTKYRLGEDFEVAEEKLNTIKLNNMNQDCKIVKGKKVTKPFLLEYNTIADVEDARKSKSREIMDLVKQIRLSNEKVKRRIQNLEVM